MHNIRQCNIPIKLSSQCVAEHNVVSVAQNSLIHNSIAKLVYVIVWQ